MALAMRNSFALTSPRLLRASRCSSRAPTGARARALQAQAFTVTLKTPDGEQQVEVGEDTYILDAAEVCFLPGYLSPTLRCRGVSTSLLLH